ncbi:M15 family metallopeptidase [Dechloromonas sp. CZR5]|uniref:M15 family metallopeptidase n=1 Tax=Dechloromonas sp. CZR5 TaxID=2608630 RepID=UPI00168B4459|nr:M15 family metallopeptidase [Dechloromonas sp. CZR5]
MVAATVFVYFLVVVLGVVLVVFPAQRERMLALFSLMLGVGVLPFARKAGRCIVGVMDVGRKARGSFRGVGRFAVENPVLAAGALFLLGAPSLLALAVHRPAVFDFYEAGRTTDRQIAVLLEGEQLVPPPPLPPEVFTTREVEMVRPDAIHASRNWGLLDAEFTQRLLVVYKLMKERHGYEMVLIEGYRSPERQARLFEQGAHVTQAGANMSYHQYGLAADSAFFKDGKVLISERDPWVMRGYQLYGEVAAQVGLTWGGNWKMQDYGHVELRRPGVLGRAAAQ